MIGKRTSAEIKHAIERREFQQLRAMLQPLPPAEIADMFVDLDSEAQAVLLRILPNPLVADVFEYLQPELQERLLHALGTEQVAQILNEITPDDRTALLEELPASVTKRLLALLSPAERKIATTLLGFPEDSIGRRMTPEYVAIKKDWLVSDVLTHLRKFGHDRETLNQLFVTSADGKLAGVVRLRNLVVVGLEQPVADLIEPPVHTLRAIDDQETAVAAFKRYDRTTLPVLDMKGVLVGVVTVDDVLDVAEEEATEDIHKSGGLEPLTTSLLKARFVDLYSRRIHWLVLLVLVNILSGAGIAHFRQLIESVVALVFFLPLLIASGGNAGAQAATLVIRSISLGEIGMRDYVRVLVREMAVAVGLGLTMAATVFMIAWWRSGLPVAWAVALSMVAIVFLASLFGMSLPFILSKAKLDPAAASAPLVTSLVDIMGVLVYLSIANAMLGVAGV